MFKNYFQIATRNFKNNKLFSFVNIAGLAVGLSCFFIIIFYVLNETSYDNFHKNAERIYRFNLIGKLGGNEFVMAGSGPPLAAALQSGFPEIENVIRLRNEATVFIKHNGDLLKEENFYLADTTFFKVFSFKLIQGNALNALADPSSVLLTPEMADKYFPGKDPLGQTIELSDGRKFNVSGIIEKPPVNSHLKFNFVASILNWEQVNSPNWFSNECYTYALLKNHTDPENLRSKLPALIKENLDPMVQAAMGITYEQFVESGNEFKYHMQPLYDIHLNTSYYQEPTTTRDKTSIYVFLFIGILILSVASVNFINLSSARSIKRANEVGVRKVLGSSRIQLIRQFISESVFSTYISLFVAIVFTELALPLFENLADVELNVGMLSDWRFIPAVLVFGLFVGVVSGIFPALQLSAYQPVSILKGKIYKGKKSGKMRSSLVVFQFTISIVLVVGTLVVNEQINFIGNKKLGYKNDNMLIVQNIQRMHSNRNSFKNDILAISGVNNATYSNGLPISSLSASFYRVPGEKDSKNQTLVTMSVDDDFYDVFKLELKRGRVLSKDFPADSTSILINETAAAVLGFNDPIGRNIYSYNDNGGDIPLTIVGIVKDFHLESLHRDIRPMIITSMVPEFTRFISVSLDGTNVKEAVNKIETLWKQNLPGEPFEYFFMDENFDEIYRAELQTGRIFLTFSLLAIFIASLGLFGLAAFSAEQRTKEIGIRKVHGATISNIILMLSKDFAKLILISSVIACPLGYYFMNKWLQDFAYRINLGAGVFIFACLFAIFIALSTVVYQAFKAANSNPVRSLRYD